MRTALLIVFLGAAIAAAYHAKRPREPSYCQLADIKAGHHFWHDGEYWMRCEPSWTGYEDSDEAMAMGQRAEKDVADGGTVRIWCVCLTDGDKYHRGGLRPIWETTTVQRP